MDLLSNLLSGMLGAAVGAGVAYYISYRSQLNAARLKLLGIVFQLGYDAYSKAEDGRPEIPFRERYPSLWVAYADLRRYLPSWKRKALHKAWNKFIRADFYDQIPDDQWGKVFYKGATRTREEAVELSSAFIRFLDRL